MNVHARQKLIRFFIQCRFAGNRPGRYHFYHFSFDNSLRQLWILHLFADSHTMAGIHQFVQIIIDGVIRKSRQGYFAGRAVGSFGEHNAKHFRRNDSIITECFVEITHTEENNGIAVLALYFLILTHEGGALGWCFFTHKANPLITYQGFVV